MKKFSTAIIFGLAVAFGACMLSFSPPEYQGSFKWVRTEIEGSELRKINPEVFDSLEKMNKIFSLEAGDECFFLLDKEWIWRDKKDPAFLLAPVFCPEKGGGWAMPPSSRFDRGISIEKKD